MTATEVQLRRVLLLCREKLVLYRKEHTGEYVGGMEYTVLLREIDAALTGGEPKVSRETAG